MNTAQQKALKDLADVYVQLEQLQNQAKQAEVELIDKRADALVLARSTGLTWAQISEHLATAILRDEPFSIGWLIQASKTRAEQLDRRRNLNKPVGVR